MATIACDTDFLIKIANDPLPKFDWTALSSQNEFCTLPCIVRELTNLKSSRQRQTSRRAVMALSIIGQVPSSKIKLLTTKDSKPKWAEKSISADEALVEFVKEDGRKRMVATLDGELLSKLDTGGLPYLTLSSGRPLLSSGRAMHLSRTDDK
jgi:rRNA-processing protein FCF1